MTECHSDGNENVNDCCELTCCFQKLGVLTTQVNEDESKQVDVDWRGLVYSFLLSVGNDTLWTPVVNETVKRCYEQFSNSGEFDCKGQIPKHLFHIIDCSYLENYLKCAKWNPHDLKECEYTYQYVKKCR